MINKTAVNLNEPIKAVQITCAKYAYNDAGVGISVHFLLFSHNIWLSTSYYSKLHLLRYMIIVKPKLLIYCNYITMYINRAK